MTSPAQLSGFSLKTLTAISLNAHSAQDSQKSTDARFDEVGCDRGPNGGTCRQRPPIVMLTSQFPSLSETFVQSDIVGLKARGWPLKIVSLRRGSSISSHCPVESSVVIYESKIQFFLAAITEIIAHPVSCIRTFVASVKDALNPGEPASPLARIKGIAHATAGISVAHRLRSSAPRHLHCHFAHAPTSVGMYAAKQLAIPFSFTGHANDLFQNRVLLKRKLERAAFVACISHWHREFYTSICPISERKSRVIRCGVDTSHWTERNFQSNKSKVRLISVCRLVEKKGMDTLLRAIATMESKWRERITLTIVGDGPDREKLLQMAHDLRCDNLLELAGALPHEAVRARLLDADVFVLPCKTDRNGDRDGIPVALMEAMACGVPVVAGDLPAIRELVVNNQTGRLVAPDDSAALASVLAELAASPEDRTRLAIAGRHHVEAEFSRELNHDRLEEALCEALKLDNSNCNPAPRR
jgi:colanic acid/amylovoran biosynthesis glycosyltransferase